MSPTITDPEKAALERMLNDYDEDLNDILLGAFCNAIEKWKDKPHIIHLDVINPTNRQLLRAVVNDLAVVYKINEALRNIIRDDLKSRGL